MLSRLSDTLNESVMGFLALAGLSFGLAPFLFELPRYIEQGFDFAKWAIVGLFALEYAVNFALSTDRRKFVFSLWRLLDAVIILTPLFSLLTAGFGSASSSPALRIVRLFSILLFGPFVGHGLRKPSPPIIHPPPTGRPKVWAFRPGDVTPAKFDWDELLRWAANPTSSWLHACNLSHEHLVEIASAAGVTKVMVETALQESSYPRIEPGARWTAVTVSLSSPDEPIHRDPALMLISPNSILSLSLHSLDLQQQPPESGTLPWGPRCALHVIRLVLARDETLAGRLERMVRKFEEMPVVESPESFFRQTFHLKRILSTTRSDLWRLRGLLERISDGRRQLPGINPDQRDLVNPLVDEADYLYETVDNIREAVLSLIELHIDIAAHDTTRFMRLLAIVSTLALIPAVLGGLLGMNLIDAPWEVTLGQVAFGTMVLMIGVLYIFMAKGWLR